MTRIGCFTLLLVGKKKKSKESVKLVDARQTIDTVLRTEQGEFIYPSAEKGLKEGVLALKSISHDGAKVEVVVTEAAYEGGDEHEDILSLKRDYSDLDLQALCGERGDANSDGYNEEASNDELENISGEVVRRTSPEVIQSGHVSDPGIGRTTNFWGSPKLKRSCSNIETKRGSRSSINSYSYDDLQNLSGNYNGEAPNCITGSPVSVMTSCSADKVMLKKKSSSQVLPSRSRKLWWKLFLWSHRNLHKPWTSKLPRIASSNNASEQKCGYCSDTLEPSNDVGMNKRVVEEDPVMKTRAGLWPQHQWVAFSVESSSMDRVNAWVHSLDDSLICPVNDPVNGDGEATPALFSYPSSITIRESSSKNHAHLGRRTLEEVMQANSIIQSLNTVSSVAHISGMGLKVLPAISAFSSLRAVNLSSNFIVHISPGSLPKSLHTLDLSRNKISTIEGLRDLARLRFLNLSYNKITRIGHGLANCTLIKELYLAANKISDVEGLHRLLKLTVLDLSFNKISTAKALGQLVANYNTLLALNLLGNPVQSNIGDEQLRKTVSGLLPKLTYLNKQPIKPQRAREVATDSIAKAALGNTGWSPRRRTTIRRVGQSSSASVKGRTGEGNGRRGSGSSIGPKNGRYKSKNRHSSRK